MDGGDEMEGDDPFQDLQLDDDFVAGATRVEESAETRISRLQRIDREHRALNTVPPSRMHKLRRRRARHRRLRGLKAWVPAVVFVLVAATFAWQTHDGSGGSGVPGGTGVADLVGGGVQTVADRPSPSAEEQDAPLGSPSVGGVEDGSYALIDTQPDGTPVAYDPCRPIHYVVNPDNAPAGTTGLVPQAFAAASAASGLQFVDDGPTTERGMVDREVFQPGSYGDRWAPVLVTWSNAAEVEALTGDTAGLGGSASIEVGNGKQVFISGAIALDTADIGRMLAEPDGRQFVLDTIEHEIGHVLGLGHVDDPGQLMYPEVTGQIHGYQTGDMTGLALLGRGECFPEI